MHHCIGSYETVLISDTSYYVQKIKPALLWFRSMGQQLEEGSDNQGSWLLFLAVALTHSMTLCKSVDLCACLPMQQNEKNNKHQPCRGWNPWLKRALYTGIVDKLNKSWMSFGWVTKHLLYEVSASRSHYVFQRHTYGPIFKTLGSVTHRGISYSMAI